MSFFASRKDSVILMFSPLYLSSFSFDTIPTFIKFTALLTMPSPNNHVKLMPVKAMNHVAGVIARNAIATNEAALAPAILALSVTNISIAYILYQYRYLLLKF